MIGGTWGEIDLHEKDLDGAVRQVEGQARGEQARHVVPLSAGALAILKGLLSGNAPDGAAFVFAGADGRPLSNMACSNA